MNIFLSGSSNNGSLIVYTFPLHYKYLENISINVLYRYKFQKKQGTLFKLIKV